MTLPLKKYLKLLVNYLRPQSRRTLLMGLLLLTSIGLQLANTQVLRYFIDTATGGGTAPSLMVAALLFIGIALTNRTRSLYAPCISEHVACSATTPLRTAVFPACLT